MADTSTIPLPDVEKTTAQRLIERCDPDRRDVRQIIWELYERHGRLESVTDELNRLLEETGETVTLSGVSRWCDGWGWRFERILVAPAPAEKVTA